MREIKGLDIWTIDPGPRINRILFVFLLRNVVFRELLSEEIAS